MSGKDHKTGRVKPSASPACPAKHSTIVFDATGENWMSRWNKVFSTFEISHLRISLWFQVDPGDRDALLAYCHEEGKKEDLVEIAGGVGKEVSKHKRKQRQQRMSEQGVRGNCVSAYLFRRSREVIINERDPQKFFTPSQRHFKAHCQCIIDRYGLQAGMVRKQSVSDLIFGACPETGSEEDIFRIQTSAGTRHARTVVLAVGPANLPTSRPFQA